MPACSRIGELKEDERVFVSAAAGAVGAIVCQIAKNKGCRVVGSAGSDEKCAWLTNEAALAAAINYKKARQSQRCAAEALPEGIDVYFDNVGGGASEGGARQHAPVRPHRGVRHDRAVQRDRTAERTAQSDGIVGLSLTIAGSSSAITST